MSEQLNIFLLVIRYRVEIITFPSSQQHSVIVMSTGCGADSLCSYFTFPLTSTEVLGKNYLYFPVSQIAVSVK